MAKPSLPRAAPRSSQRNGDGMLADAIALVQTSSLPALVQQELERMILSGELSGGAKLTEVALARTGTLAVSTREHRVIVERIAARNPAAAGKAMLDHVLASRERMRASHGESSLPRKLAVVEARRSR